MRVEDLTKIIAQRNPLLANAVSKIAVYVQDCFPAAFPSKEQTEAVNCYLDSVCKLKHEPMTETECEHRRLASHKITIAAIRVLDKTELDRMQDVLDHISLTGSIICRRNSEDGTSDIFFFWLSQLLTSETD